MGMYIMSMHLMGVYLMGVHLTGVYLIGTYGRASHGRAYLYEAPIQGKYLSHPIYYSNANFPAVEIPAASISR